MDSCKNTFTQSNMTEDVMIKTEPVFEQELEQISPGPLEPSTEIKPEVCSEEELITTCNDKQNNCEIRNKNLSSLSNKTLINLNGVLYFIERIPEASTEKKQSGKTVCRSYKTFLDDPVPCPNCGKILKRRRNLKLHMQVCHSNISYNCDICSYKTSSEILLALHVSACKKRTTTQTLLTNNENNDDKGYYSHICLKCNTTSSFYFKECDKCGSLKRWQCKNCKKSFDSHSKVRYHYITICNPAGFYRCVKCDYRSVHQNFAKEHIKKSHPELISNGISEYIKKVKLPSDANGTKHVCSKCGKKFREPKDINRHTRQCKKSRVMYEEIDTDECFRQYIIHHCETCDKNIELKPLQEEHVPFQESCTDCLSTLLYKCTKCDNLYQNYDAIVNHVKTVCSQKKLIKCAQCNYLTYVKAKLIEHTKRVHGDISATCTNCGSYFTNSTAFERHITFCGSSTTLECDMCPFRTSAKEYLQRHMSTVHDKLNTPNVSRSSIKSKCNFSRIRPHIQSHCVKCYRRQETNLRMKFCKNCNNKLQFRCITCDKMNQIDNPDICVHAKAFLEYLAFECKRCGKGFYNQKKYEFHESWCGKTRIYSCKLCAYTSKYPIQLREHERQVHYTNRKNKYPQETCSNQINKNVAESHSLSHKSKTKLSLKKDISLKINKDSGSLQYHDPAKEMKNYSYFTTYENDNKLNLQCEVVLTRLNI